MASPGSYPRMRGTGLGFRLGLSVGRFIPACAGNRHVKRAARQLRFDGIENNPGSTARRIWRSIGSLDPSNKNGFRVRIDTERHEIRGIRGKGEWILKLPTIERDEILAQVRQNSAEPVQFVVSK